VIRLFIAVVLISLSSQQAAFAGRAAVRCVQAQLNKLEFGAGAVDGALGPKTRAAYNRLKSEQPDLAFDTKLNRDNAIVLCRELGLAQSRLRLDWPAFLKRFETRYDPGVSAENQKILNSSVSDALNKLAKRFKISLAGQFIVLSAIDPRDMRKLVEKTLGGRVDRHAFQKFMTLTCPKTTPIGGFAGGPYIAVCFPKGNPDVKRYNMNKPGTGNRNRDLLNDVVFHEVIHVAQRQFAGYSGRKPSKGRISKMGPEWLIEGVAEVLTQLALSPEVKLKPRMAALKVMAGGPSADISKYNAYDARKKDRDGLYIQGVLASYHLARIAGDHALLNFYRDIGNGLTWQQSFKTNFKLTPEQFYAVFAES
jgi:hypothetical protein